jgi:trehalose/maltose hydrolase-like predicted phosphorylase
MLRPEIARSAILNYRVARLYEAEQKALSYKKNYQGAMFPWESAFTGVETCPTVAPTGLLEQHISGDIVFAVKQFYRTQITDQQLQAFSKQFSPLILEVAKFFASRVTPRPDSNMFDINGVIPPDEYAVNVNNSIYTNVVAQISLEFAIELVRKFNLPVSETILDNWNNIAQNLYMPFDEQRQIHLEYEGYKDELIKQADVVLLKFPLMWKGYEGKTASNDLQFYEGVTDAKNGPAMTFGMYAVGWISEGDLSKAVPLFSQSYANVHEPYLVWTETPAGGAINFITGAGGFLQAVMYGYGGLRILDADSYHAMFKFKNALQFDPQLPPDSSFVRLRGLHFQGYEFNVEYNTTTVSVRTTESGPSPLYVSDPSGTVSQLSQIVSFKKNGKFYLFQK